MHIHELGNIIRYGVIVLCVCKLAPCCFSNHVYNDALLVFYCLYIGYEPADLTVHPPPKTIEGGFIFISWVSSVTNFFSSKEKVDFVGDIRISTHKNVVLRHNH